MTRMTDAEVMALFQDGDNALNRALREFSGGCARIEQAHQQRMPPSPVETRRMEFEAVQKIAAALSPPEPTDLLMQAENMIAAWDRMYQLINPRDNFPGVFADLTEDMEFRELEWLRRAVNNAKAAAPVPLQQRATESLRLAQFPTPWSSQKRYHCPDCAAADENFSWVIKASNGKVVTDDISNQALVGLIINAVNAALPAAPMVAEDHVEKKP